MTRPPADAPTNLVLRNRLCPGDVTVMTAAVRCLHEQHPGRFRTWVDTTAIEIWEHNPFIEHGAPPADAEIIDCHYDLVQRSNQEPRHFLEGYVEDLHARHGIPVRLTRKTPDLHLSEEERGWINQVEETLGRPQRFWLINAGHKDDFTAKHWGRERYQALVDSLKGEVFFVQIGELHHNHPPIAGALDLRGRTTIRQLMRLVAHCDGAVGPTTFLQHLCAGFSKPYVCLLGGREPVQWVQYPTQTTLHTIGALDCCKADACWRSRTVPLHDGRDDSLCLAPDTSGPEPVPTCMTLITVEEVAAAVRRYIKGSRYVIPLLQQPDPKPSPAIAQKPGEISFGFDHGLGDCANMAAAVAVLASRGNKVTVGCQPDKAPLFAAAGATVASLDAHPHHDYWHPDVQAKSQVGDGYLGNKALHGLRQSPIPDQGDPLALWNELKQARLSIPRAKVPRFGHRLVLFHPFGNTSPESKNLELSTVIDVCKGLLDTTDATILLLDWDNRAPRLNSKRCLHLLDEMGPIGLPELLGLMDDAAMFVGVDSGPLHLARHATCPVLGVWEHHYPAEFFIPHRRAAHLVAGRHREADRWCRDEWCTMLAQGEHLTADEVLWHARQLLETRMPRVVQHRSFIRRARTDRAATTCYVDRHRSFEAAFAGLPINRPTIVETGTIRAHDDWGAGFFTYVAGHRLHHLHLDGRLISIELDRSKLEFARQYVDQFPEVRLVHGDSRQVIADLVHKGLKIDLLYCDSADVGTPGFASVCLDEIKAAEHALTDGGQVLIDDTVWKGRWEGKGEQGVPYLLDRGWEIAYAGYQVLVRRKP